MLSNLVAQQEDWLLISPVMGNVSAINNHQISNNRNLVCDYVRFSAIPDICYCVFHNKQANKTAIDIKKIQDSLRVVSSKHHNRLTCLAYNDTS